MCEASEIRIMTRHPKLRHDDLCKFIHVRSERLQMLICINGVKQKKSKRERKKKERENHSFFKLSSFYDANRCHSLSL